MVRPYRVDLLASFSLETKLIRPFLRDASILGGSWLSEGLAQQLHFYAEPIHTFAPSALVNLGNTSV